MIVTARTSPKTGAADILPIAWICYGFGSLVAGILATILRNHVGLCFAVASIPPLLVTIASWNLDKSLEANHEDLKDMTLVQRSKFIFAQWRFGLRTRLIQMAILY